MGNRNATSKKNDQTIDVQTIDKLLEIKIGTKIE